MNILTVALFVRASITTRKENVHTTHERERELKTAKRVKGHTRYKNKEGKVVPGVSTIVNQLDKPYLINWANKLGLEGIESSKLVGMAQDIGTLAHHMIECNLTGRSYELDEQAPDIINAASKAFDSYADWGAVQDNLQVIAVEEKVVDEEWQYGGTLDLVCDIGGRRTLVDFKTGSGIYFGNKVQVAAYKHLVPVDEVRIVRVGREGGQYEEHVLTDTDRYFELFCHLREVYTLQKKLNQGV